MFVSRVKYCSKQMVILWKPNFCLKVLSSHLNGVTTLIPSLLKTRVSVSLVKMFNDTISQEELKTFFSSFKDFWEFSVPGRWLMGPGQFRLSTSLNCLSLEDDFRQLVSSNPLFRFSKMTFRCHLITDDDLPGPGWLRLVISRNWLGPSKSSSGDWKITEWDKVVSEILKLLKMVLCSSREIISLIFFLTCRPSSILRRIEWV